MGTVFKGQSFFTAYQQQFNYSTLSPLCYNYAFSWAHRHGFLKVGSIPVEVTDSYTASLKEGTGRGPLGHTAGTQNLTILKVPSNTNHSMIFYSKWI